MFGDQGHKEINKMNIKYNEKIPTYSFIEGLFREIQNKKLEIKEVRQEYQNVIETLQKVINQQLRVDQIKEQEAQIKIMERKLEEEKGSYQNLVDRVTPYS